MIDTVLQYLQSIKMSAAQWLIVTIAAVVGGLVAALEVEGSRLHRSQVELLGSRLEGKEKDASDATRKARDAYNKAKQAFKDAGGEM